ncbi:SDR family NAD(P)-dependent oxidoreductase [Bacillus sp. Marseille-P3661]|uniref:SDR family NAD(P)-dependent oxidoreductase n=1 Tax=Bacillus sp. Marseille-P3661 TaxID=1936234 RepID=UPI000C859BE3|nr:SDR family oxidoreductase [Bacillus sp. Marseille-P3661]
MEQKVAIVTGGTYGIGKEVALRLANENYKVIVIGRSEKNQHESKKYFKSKNADVDVELCDVSKSAEVDQIINKVIQKYQKIDVLCNLAAIRPIGNILETDQDTWENVFDVNVKGVYLFCRGVIPYMKQNKGGAIINFGSTSGYGGTDHIAYCATKGAIISFTKSLALDHIRDHIRVNGIIPGSTRSGMNEDRPEEITRKIAEGNVAGRINEPEDIANAVSFLVSDEAATISGTFLDIGSVQGKMAIIQRW